VNGVGEPIRDDTYLILLNPHTEPIRFFMPRRPGTAWELILDSALADSTDGKIVPAGEPFDLIPRSTALLREMRD
jgi:glycogen operon protein